MKLRLRLSLAAAAVTLPMMLALLWFDAAAQHRAAEQVLTAYVSARMPGQRERCEAEPAMWGGELPAWGNATLPPSASAPRGDPPRAPPPRDEMRRGEPPRREPPPPPPPPPGPRGTHARPAVLFAYSEDFTARNPAAPVLSEAQRQSIVGRDLVVTPFPRGSDEVEVFVRTAWGAGPCAYVLARGSTDPAWGSILPETQLWALPMVIMLAAVLLAMGPVVGRIRALTEAVRRSASAAYESPVAIEGGDEVAELSRAFDAAAREIRERLEEKERRERALRDFLANTTHDVMIPLTVLQGHLSTLRERAAAGNPVEASVVIAAMNEAHYMGSLVHNLGAAARLEAATMELSRSAVDLVALVERVIGRHGLVARELGVALERAVPGEATIVSADVTLLEQAVSNVTYNAIRYNHPGGHVAVILEHLEGARFCLRVIDDGPGIPEGEIAKLSSRGARGEAARTRAPEGQGLGLHIAFRAAELHRFRLTLGPSEYGGLEVTLEGPLAREPADAA